MRKNYYSSFNSVNIPDEISNQDCGTEENEDIDEDGRSNETGTVIVNKNNHVIYCLTIIGEIEGHCVAPPKNKATKYENLLPLLVSLEENPVIEGVLILINTIGGDIEAGLAISELLAGMQKPTVSLVLGGSHSIGVPLAVSAKKSFIVKSASMTLHPVRTSGTLLGVPQTFENFKRLHQRITDFVASHSKISAKRFKELSLKSGEIATDMGTVLEGEKAVQEGLIDEVGSLKEALGALYKMIEKK